MAQQSINVFRSTRIVTPVGRASYPNLFKPKAFDDNSEPKFSCGVIIKKDKMGLEFMDRLTKLREAALSELYPKKRPSAIEYWGVTDCDEPEFDAKGMEEVTKGCWIIKASCKNRPGAVDFDKQEIMDEATIYGGCDLRMNVCAKAYGTPARGGVTLELVSVQFIGDNDPFGGAAAAVAASISEF